MGFCQLNIYIYICFTGILQGEKGSSPWKTPIIYGLTWVDDVERHDWAMAGLWLGGSCIFSLGDWFHCPPTEMVELICTLGKVWWKKRQPVPKSHKSDLSTIIVISSNAWSKMDSATVYGLHPMKLSLDSRTNPAVALSMKAFFAMVTGTTFVRLLDTIEM